MKRRTSELRTSRVRTRPSPEGAGAGQGRSNGDSAARAARHLFRVEGERGGQEGWCRWERRRTTQEIDEATAVDLKDLKDPEKDSDRAKNPEWLVMVGVCTHLGCVPLGNKGEYNGWFCPCHGSHYDTSGRVRKGPAPNNLEIPKYEFLDNNTIKIG